jgi:tripartite-type tricarboxylate transporter receptor subunit TctC
MNLSKPGKSNTLRRIIMKKRIIGSLFWVSILFMLVCISFNHPWAAEKYPSRSIELVCGMAPGGASDILNRMLARYFEKYLGVAVVPTNKPGAAQVVGTTYLAKSAPDGYTIGNMSIQVVTAIVAGQATTYSLDDVRAVCQLAYVGTVLGVPTDSPWKTFQEFMDYARKNPGVKYAHQGVGSGAHIRMETLNRYAKLGLAGIPFNGEGEMIPAVLGKHLPIAGFSPGGVRPQVEAGKMRILFSFDPPAEVGFDPTLPHLLSVFGKDAPDLDISVYLWMPRKTPDEIVRMIEQTYVKMTKDPEFISELRKNNYVPAYIDGNTVMQKKIPEKMPQMKETLQFVGMLK